MYTYTAPAEPAMKVLDTTEFTNSCGTYVNNGQDLFVIFDNDRDLQLFIRKMNTVAND